MGVLITTGTLPAGSRRIIDRAPSGRLWVMHFATGSVIQFWYSDNDGVTWAKATGDLISTVGGSLFVDLDGGLNVAYEGAGTGFAYRRGTVSGTTITWSTEFIVGGSRSVHDLVTFRHPAGGWSSLMNVRSTDGLGPHLVYWLRVIDTTITLGGTFDLVPGLLQGGAGFTGAIDFHHTGDGKTVQGGTPHGYISWIVAGTGARWSKRLVWNGASYTLSSAQIISAGSGVFQHMAFDGVRTMVAVNGGFNGQVKLVEIDAGNIAQIDRGTSAAISTSGLHAQTSMSYDRDGNIYMLSISPTDSDLYRTKWTRASLTWDASWTLVLAGTWTGSTLRKGYAFGASARIEGGYSDGTNIFYQEVLILNTPPTAPTVLDPPDGAVRDVATSLGISWKFNDPDAGDSQTAYTVRRRIGVLAGNYWNGTAFVAAESGATKIVSSAASLGLAAGWGADSDSGHYYSVKTWDTGDSLSPWSAETRVVPSGKDNPTITDPATDGFDITTATYPVVWTVNTQTKYRIRIIGNTAGAPDPAIVDYDSGVINQTVTRTHLTSFPVNSVTRQIELTTWNDEGLMSTVVYRIVDIIFVPPNTPTLTLNAGIAVPGAIRVTINNPGGGGAPSVVSNDIYRRLAGTSGDGIRVAAGHAVNVVFDDYAVASGVGYSYRAKAITATGALAYSAWVT